MLKKRFTFLLAALSVLLVLTAVSRPYLAKAPAQGIEDASDFYQRHPDWTWISSGETVLIPVTGEVDFPDYAQRHPELSALAAAVVDLTDYYIRHPELRVSMRQIDTTDFYFPHFQPFLPASVI